MDTKRLLFYDNIRNDEIIKTAEKIQKNLNAAVSGSVIFEETENQYYELQRSLLRAVPYGETPGTYWENYICRLIAESENPFSIMAEKGELEMVTELLAAEEVQELCGVFSADWIFAEKKFGYGKPCVCTLCPPMREDTGTTEIYHLMKKASQMLGKAKDHMSTVVAGGMIESELSDYYRKHFCGILGKYQTFLWDGTLNGIRHQDPITFDDLIGYDVQQQTLIRNTEVFLKGGRANNVLLYGDKGTGKSSSVKALLNRFGKDGLRMINVPKSHIFDIGKIMDKVSGRGCRFIIFIDDLSFEETESEYKHFKSVLEGGVEIQPENVLLYVTSNRRNLVKETWKDRSESEGEVYLSDGIHERQSLADRFGLKITFTAPDRELYTEIVKSIAQREGVEIEPEQLLAEANKWDMRQTSRSGRSAKQFVTHIAGMAHQED